MKTKILFLLIALSAFSINAITATENLVNTTTTIVCETEQIQGVFDGADDFGYTFILTLDYGEGVVFTFNKLEREVSETFDLTSEDLVGKTFLISFEMMPAKDPNGIEVATSIYAITALEIV